jgi:hypothetical protein
MPCLNNFSRPCLALVLGLALVEPARAESPACPGPTSAVATEAARSAFREGQTAFNEGDYAHAVELWQLAYTKDCTAHALLLNLATAQELAGKPGDAIQSLELFNERAPGSSYEEPNRRRIERLQHALAEASAAPKTEPAPKPNPAPAPLHAAAPLAAPSPPAPPPPAAPAPVPVATAAAASEVPPSVIDPSPFRAAPANGDGSSERSMLPLGVAAVGAAAGLLGSLVYVNAMVAAGSAGDRCGGSRAACTDPRAAADGEAARARAETAGWVTGIGVVTAVGGVVWYLAQPTASRAPEQQAKTWRWDAELARGSGYLRTTHAF